MLKTGILARYFQTYICVATTQSKRNSSIWFDTIFCNSEVTTYQGLAENRFTCKLLFNEVGDVCHSANHDRWLPRLVIMRRASLQLPLDFKSINLHLHCRDIREALSSMRV
ncbi:hypothetical protein NXS19_003991 [Fusarium pseudograminearum]|nr:hypothetical protein NXS19_003991 [Fusarium pseudograminearum]